MPPNTDEVWPHLMCTGKCMKVQMYELRRTVQRKTLEDVVRETSQLIEVWLKTNAKLLWSVYMSNMRLYESSQFIRPTVGIIA